MSKEAKVDRNQKEIVKALRAAGAGVIITSQLKNAFDILVAYKGGLYVMEIKDGDLPPSKKELTEGEAKCKDMLNSKGVSYYVVCSIEDALKIILEKSH